MFPIILQEISRFRPTLVCLSSGRIRCAFFRENLWWQHSPEGVSRLSYIGTYQSYIPIELRASIIFHVIENQRRVTSVFIFTIHPTGRYYVKWTHTHTHEPYINCRSVNRAIAHCTMRRDLPAKMCDFAETQRQPEIVFLTRIDLHFEIKLHSRKQFHGYRSALFPAALENRGSSIASTYRERDWWYLNSFSFTARYVCPTCEQIERYFPYFRARLPSETTSSSDWALSRADGYCWPVKPELEKVPKRSTRQVVIITADLRIVRNRVLRKPTVAIDRLMRKQEPKQKLCNRMISFFGVRLYNERGEARTARARVRKKNRFSAESHLKPVPRLILSPIRRTRSRTP